VKLIIQPDAGVAPVLQAIRRARKTIDVTIFRLDREEIVAALEQAVSRGVRVRALIAHTNRGGERRLRKLELELLAGGITVTRTADDLPRYHGKLLITDDTLHVLGFNLTSLDIARSRSFGIATRDRKALAEARRLFETDCTRQPYVASRCNLVVSPETSRDLLARFIRGARRSLAIYDNRLEDPRFVALLRERSAKGVDVRVIGTLKGPGAERLEERKLQGRRLHVRAIVRDGTAAFLGSQSLRRLELDGRREIGLIVKNATIARQILQVFEADWERSAPLAQAARRVVAEDEPAAGAEANVA
jgi:phosphatidylserine/phosphatidylglycerophosphate/cardiolipin synthase-like enzyme